MIRAPSVVALVALVALTALATALPGQRTQRLPEGIDWLDRGVPDSGPTGSHDRLAPILEPGLGPLRPGQDPPADTFPNFHGSVNIGAVASTGNTKRRTVNAAAETIRRGESNRLTLKAAWNFAQEKLVTDTDYQVDQRHTEGSIKYDQFMTKKLFAFVATDARYDWAKNVELRYTATAGFGEQFIEQKHLKFSAEVGGGYYQQESRIAGVPDNNYLAGRVSWDVDWQITEGWRLLHGGKYSPSLEDKDELTFSLDTRLRAAVSKGMFAQLQWIFDYDSTPLLNALSQPNERVDHRLFLTLGWTF